jgi:hypothetical protein
VRRSAWRPHARARHAPSGQAATGRPSSSAPCGGRAPIGQIATLPDRARIVLLEEVHRNAGPLRHQIIGKRGVAHLALRGRSGKATPMHSFLTLNGAEPYGTPSNVMSAGIVVLAAVAFKRGRGDLLPWRPPCGAFRVTACQCCRSTCRIVCGSSGEPGNPFLDARRLDRTSPPTSALR